jgi:ubiquinone/menaquinone biosynthesis C-methylase UbiE
MLAECHRISPEVPVVLGDAHRLPIRDNGIDLLLFVTTLEFLTNPEQGISEAIRVARQGVILVVLNKWSLSALGRRMARARHPLLRHARDFSLASLLRMAKQIGGTRLKEIRWRSSLYPDGLYRALASIPIGDVIGMALLLEETPEDGYSKV